MFGILATHELFHFIIGLDNNDDIKNNDCPATVNSILFRHYQQCKQNDVTDQSNQENKIYWGEKMSILKIFSQLVYL